MMDFFDVFMKMEEMNNQAALNIFQQTHPQLFLSRDKEYTLFVVDDFIDLNDFDKEEFKFVLGYISLLEGGADTGYLSPSQLIAFLKFYWYVLGDYEAAAENMNKMFGSYLLEIPITDLLIDNFLDSLDIYDNFVNNDNIEEYENIRLGKKLIMSYEDMIIIIYTKLNKLSIW